MRKSLLFSLLVLAACEPPPAESGVDTAEAVSAIQPSSMLRLWIPPAPRAVSPRAWTPGSPFVPVSRSVLSFHYVYAVDQANPTVVHAAGFDVAGGVALFNYDVPVGQITDFLGEISVVQNHYSLTVEGGGQGNVTPKCCITPGGTTFFQYAWAAAYVQHQVGSTLFQ